MVFTHHPIDPDTHRPEAGFLQEAASCGSGALAAIASILFGFN